MYIRSDEDIHSLLSPIEPHGVGKPVDDKEEYVWLDQEMMKVNSLSHGSIRWDEVESKAVHLLGSVGKDLTVLGYLLQCMQKDADITRFAMSLRILSGFVKNYWENAYPYQGEKGKKRRDKLLEKFLRQGMAKAELLDFSGGGEEFEACRTELRQLQAGLTEESVLAEPLEQFIQTVCSKAPGSPEGTELPKEAGEKPTMTKTVDKNEPQAYQAKAPECPDIRLEAGNHRDNRNALLRLADYLNTTNQGDPLGYRIRRYAIWSTIQAAPTSDENHCTVLVAPSTERLGEYREALSRNVTDPALWTRIEHSVSVSPFWIEGHRLSATMAQNLGYERCSDAIRDEAKQFINRMPELKSLSFQNGSPFVDEETSTWLHNDGASVNAGPEALPRTQGEDWQEGLVQARACLAEQNLEGAFKALDAGAAKAKSPRESVYWRIASADLLKSAGYAALAAQQYEAIRQSVSGLALENWEPNLLTLIQKACSSYKATPPNAPKRQESAK